MSDFETLYDTLIETLKAQGLNTAGLTRGDKSVQYRSAQDLIDLLNYLNSQKSADTASVRTVARNVRPTI